MVRTIGLFLAAACFTCFQPHSADAAEPEKGIEVGVGLGATGLIIGGGDTYFRLQVNQQYVKAGFYVSPTVSIEPGIALDILSGGGGTSAVVELGVAVPVHFEPTWGRSGLYVAPHLNLTILSADAAFGESAKQFTLGVGLGKKIQVQDTVVIRPEGFLDYAFESEFFGDALTLGAQVGIGIFF